MGVGESLYRVVLVHSLMLYIPAGKIHCTSFTATSHNSDANMDQSTREKNVSLASSIFSAMSVLFFISPTICVPCSRLLIWLCRQGLSIELLLPIVNTGKRGKVDQSTNEKKTRNPSEIHQYNWYVKCKCGKVDLSTNEKNETRQRFTNTTDMQNVNVVKQTKVQTRKTKPIWDSPIQLICKV